MLRKICPPETETIGRSVQAFMASINHENFRPILEKYGFASGIDPDKWYPLQDVLATLTEIAEQPGAMFDLVSIGTAAAGASQLTPELQQLSFGEFLALYGKALYPSRHRNGDAGTISAEPVGENHVKMVLDIYYPDDLMYGIFYGLARLFLPEESRFTVAYDEDQIRKDKGGDNTVIHVMWD